MKRATEKQILPRNPIRVRAFNFLSQVCELFSYKISTFTFESFLFNKVSLNTYKQRRSCLSFTICYRRLETFRCGCLRHPTFFFALFCPHTPQIGSIQFTTKQREPHILNGR